MNADLLRQRRNLILVCTALIMFEFAKVSIAKVSILGTELVVGDARVLHIFAWVVWAYFLLRYYQYLMLEGDLMLIATARGRFESKAMPYVMKLIGKQSLTGKINFTRKFIFWKYSVLERVQTNKFGYDKETHSGRVPFLRSILWWANGFLYLILHTPKATDHLLPFALAVMAPAIALLRHFALLGT
jgi:hypothetical protein